jgi:hypothetical protein
MLLAVQNALSPVPNHFGGGVSYSAGSVAFRADLRGFRRVERASMNRSRALGRMRTERPIRTISMSPHAMASSTVRRQVARISATSWRVSNDGEIVVPLVVFDAWCSIPPHQKTLRCVPNCGTIRAYCPQKPGTASTVARPSLNVLPKIPPRQLVSVNSTSSP